MLKFVVPPIVGAIIGLITTGLAIMMLFYPRKPIYIGKQRLPFTPGIIPKEKGKIAKSIGNAVGSQFVSSNSITAALLSDEILDRVRKRTEDFFEENRSNDKTIDEVLKESELSNEDDNSLNELKDGLVNIICKRIIDMHLGNGFSSSVSEKLKDGINIFGLGMLSQRLINDEFLDSLSKSIGERIDKIIASNSKDIVQGFVDNETKKIGKMKVCEIIEKYDNEIPKVTEGVVQLYKRAVEISAEKIFSELDISELVEIIIRSFDAVELEKLIFKIMNRELKAIVCFGAFLGFVMGLVNVLFLF